jgi:hypothetical protein
MIQQGILQHVKNYIDSTRIQNPVPNKCLVDPTNGHMSAAVSVCGLDAVELAGYGYYWKKVVLSSIVL